MLHFGSTTRRHNKCNIMEFSTDFLLIVGWTIVLGILIYWYLSRNFGYWKKKGLPYVSPTILIGSMLDTMFKPFKDLESERYTKLGRIYGSFEGSRPILTVGEPDLVRDILIKDFSIFPNRRNIETGDDITDKMMSIVQGEDWKRIRSIVSPTFSSGKLKRLTKIFKDCSSTVAENMRHSCRENEVIDIKRLYGAFTMDVIASSAFSTKLDSYNDPNNKFVSMARKFFSQNIPWRFLAFVFFPKIVKFFRLRVLAPAAIDFFKEVTLHIIEQRKKTGEAKNDFLQLLLDTTIELNADETVNKEENNDIAQNYEGEEKKEKEVFKTSYHKKGLTTNELIAQCVIFFLAGYETTASALSFASYLLAIHPEIQERVAKEIDTTLKETDGELTYEIIKKMKYLDNVISETLRLFPPAMRLERRANEDYTVSFDLDGAKKEIEIPKGFIVGIPIYPIHHDPEFYPEPETFDPDRFNDENRASRNPFTYLPFGHGPRNCVAMRFALLEMKVCLAYALSHLKFKRCSETKVPLEFFAGHGRLIPKAIKLQVEERSNCIKAC